MNNTEITNKECDWKDENGYVIAVPNHSYIKLRLVKSNAANGKNETIIMQANDDGKTFSIIKGDTGRKYGRRAPKKIPVVYSMETWDDYFWDKINKDWRVKGLEETKEKTIEKSQGDFAGVDPDVKDVLQILLGTANKVIEEQYSINIEDIPDEDLKRGQEIITELSQAGENISVAEFNNMLTELWLAVPRVIRKVNKEKVFNTTEFQAKLEKEQELLDFLMAMLRGKGNTVINDGNILTQNNLIWEPVSDKEAAMLKDKMGDQRARFLRAWRVTNTVTENVLTNTVNPETLLKIMELQNCSMVQALQTGGQLLPMDCILIRQESRYMERHLATVFILRLMQRNPLVIHLHMVLTGSMEMHQKVIWQCSRSQPETFMMCTARQWQSAL